MKTKSILLLFFLLSITIISKAQHKGLLSLPDDREAIRHLKIMNDSLCLTKGISKFSIKFTNLENESYNWMKERHEFSKDTVTIFEDGVLIPMRGGYKTIASYDIHGNLIKGKSMEAVQTEWVTWNYTDKNKYISLLNTILLCEENGDITSSLTSYYHYTMTGDKVTGITITGKNGRVFYNDKYKFDNQNRLITIDEGWQMKEVVYDSLGLISKMTITLRNPGDTPDKYSIEIENYVFDKNGRLTNIKKNQSYGNDDAKIDYNADGLISKISYITKSKKNNREEIYTYNK
jgi:hypothetical protein